jgi:RNA polymerase sigma factor (sigma-70 family)
MNWVHNGSRGNAGRMGETKKALVERLFEEHSSALRALFYRRVRHQPDAAELAQEVYLRMLRVADTDAIRNPEAYLYTVASNLAREHRVLERRQATVAELDEVNGQELLAELPGVTGKIDTETRVKRLREVLAQLPPKCQAAVALQYWHGMSYAEIAARLGISTHMVKKYLSQGLAHCRRRMARLG